MENIKQAERIQKSIINKLEHRALVWLALRQPRWVTSDILTFVGVVGAFLTGLGFYLTRYSIDWLWLSFAGLVINWYGDSLDGTLARVRNCQRPLYGYYLDHTVDCINEAFMFVGAGLSPLVHLDLALMAFILYLFLTINVSINAHLKSEFRLTYAKLGPTEFRLLIIIANSLLIAFPALATRTWSINAIHGELDPLDPLAVVIVAALAVIYLCTIISDAREYAKNDPPQKHNKQ
ncbi:MAG: CDP-alcohol phosphatidyltransferase family protein [Bacteroidales bacterium]|nr:CDP-alcohol phosphatidyltransferase family protein [Bacteroidales bacterium]